MPVNADEAWKILLDIQIIAPCVPGAKLTEIVDDVIRFPELSAKAKDLAVESAKNQEDLLKIIADLQGKLKETTTV